MNYISVNVKELIFALLGVWLGTALFGVKLMGDLALSDWKFTRFRVNFQSERAKSPINFQSERAKSPINFTPKGAVPNHTPKRAEISSFTLKPLFNIVVDRFKKF